MTTRKAIAAVAGLVLALAILSSAASALANAGGSRPLKATESSTINLDLRTLHFTAEGTGIGTIFGHYNTHAEGQVERITAGEHFPRFEASGTLAVVAANGDQPTPANGDQLTGSFKLHTSDPAPESLTAWLDITLSDGTGRFEGAQGKLETICQVGPGDRDTVPGKLISKSTCTTTGELSY
jgi:hypothetical protein